MKKPTFSAQDQKIIAQVFPLQATKSQQRQLEIIKAAIALYAKIGFDKATYEKIAEKCGVSRPLIQHYFSTREELFRASVTYIRAHMQGLAIEYLQKGKTSEEQLELYVRSCFVWARKHSSYAKVWMLYFYFATIRKDLKELHGELTKMGAQRLAALLQQGKLEGVFQSNDHIANAKMIQAMITGGLVNSITEDFPGKGESFEDQIVEQCLSIANQ